MHPLSGFPGPFWWRLSSLRLAYVSSKGKRHLILDDLHKKYGRYVRIGSSNHFVNYFGIMKYQKDPMFYPLIRRKECKLFTGCIWKRAMHILLQAIWTPLRCSSSKSPRIFTADGNVYGQRHSRDPSKLPFLSVVSTCV